MRITAKADSEIEADKLIQKMEKEVQARLGSWIYGADQETLEDVALQAVQKQGWTLAVIEAGLGGELIQRLASSTYNQGAASSGAFRGGEVLTSLPTPEELLELTNAYLQSRQVDVCLGVAIYPGPEKQDVRMVLITPDRQQQLTRPYGGPPEYAPRWALHHSLDQLRRL